MLFFEFVGCSGLFTIPSTMLIVCLKGLELDFPPVALLLEGLIHFAPPPLPEAASDIF